MTYPEVAHRFRAATMVFSKRSFSAFTAGFERKDDVRQPFCAAAVRLEGNTASKERHGQHHSRRDKNLTFRRAIAVSVKRSKLS
jgi:hypothetical protein